MSDVRDQKSKIIRHSRESGNPVWIIITLLFLLLSVSANASEIQEIKVLPEGETVISNQFGNKTVKVIIATHTVNIGGKLIEMPSEDKKVPNCTYSHDPCSIIDNIKISVDNKEIFVPHSAYADLADLVSCHLALGKDKIILYCGGGDASESYDLKLGFNSDSVLYRKKSAGEFPDSYEITSYHFDTSE